MMKTLTVCVCLLFLFIDTGTGSSEDKTSGNGKSNMIVWLLSHHLNALDAKLTKIKDNINIKDTETKQLHNGLEELKQHKADLETEITGMKKIIEDLGKPDDANIKGLKDIWSAINAIETNANEDKNKTKEAIDELQNRIVDLKTNLMDFGDKIAYKTELQHEVEKIDRYHADLENRTNSEKEELESQISELQEKQRNTDSKLNKANSERVELERLISGMESKQINTQNELNKTNMERAKQEVQLADLQAKQRHMENRLNRTDVLMDEKLQQILTNLSIVMTENGKLQSENTVIKKQISTLMSNITQLNSGKNLTEDNTTDCYRWKQTIPLLDCDNKTDGGVWMIIQRRFDGSVNFYRNWTEYENGFGNSKGEYWLGNKHIHDITAKRGYELRIVLEDWKGITKYANYANFSVGDAESQYILHVSGYSGTAGDSLMYHNGQKFSTKDRDNDKHSTLDCSQKSHGAWWYKHCFHSNLNGLYGKQTTSIWEAMRWNGFTYSLKRSKMMIRKK